jgi:uncharacterized protein YhhL (DUF1145 family)
MILARLFYYIVWIVLLVELWFLLDLKWFAGVVLTNMILIFLHRVVVMGSFLPYIQELKNMAGEIVEESKRRVGEAEDALKVVKEIAK